MGTSSRSNRQATEAFEKQARAVGYVLTAFDSVIENADSEGIWFKGMSLRPPTDEKNEWLCTVRARINDRDVIAFHSAGSFVETVKAVCDRFHNRSLVWKEDQYARG